MKVQEKNISLWVLIVACLIIISLIGLFLILCFGEEAWVSTLGYLVAALTIAIGGCVAYHHLRIIQGTERASVLTNLDTSWAGSELESSRVSILKLKSEFKDIKGIKKRNKCIRDKLRELQENNHKRYREIVAMVCFFETVGYFSKVGYILPNDAIELYGPAIRNYDDVFRGHIEELQKQDREIYVNFLWLADKAKLKYN